MAVSVSTHLVRDIRVPVETVFDFVADGENDPKWCPAVKSSRLLKGKPASPGAIYRIEQELERGNVVPMDLRLEVVERPRLLAWTMENGAMEYTSTMRFETVDGGTRITQDNHATFRRLPRLATPIVRKITRRTIRAQMDALARELGSA